MEESAKTRAERAGEPSGRGRSRFPSNGRLLVVCILIAVVVSLCVLPLEVCRDYAFICENTGSHRGYRQWRIGLQSGRWYRESRLERFMRQQHPSELTNHWTSYQGTGKNILGQSISFGHARPQVGAVIMHQSFFDPHVDTLDDAGKLSLYRVLASGDPGAIRAEEKKIEEIVLGQARILRRTERNDVEEQ